MNEIDRKTIYQFHAQFCKTLSDANRLLIIAELTKGEKSVSELVASLGLMQANLSGHLAIMRERGLVITRREGTNIYYSLSDPRIFEAIKLLIKVQTDQLEKRRVLSANVEYVDLKYDLGHS
jgi:DNA-binding transcriptional ArsR family regulator